MPRPSGKHHTSGPQRAHAAESFAQANRSSALGLASEFPKGRIGTVNRLAVLGGELEDERFGELTEAQRSLHLYAWFGDQEGNFTAESLSGGMHDRTLFNRCTYPSQLPYPN